MSTGDCHVFTQYKYSRRKKMSAAWPRQSHLSTPLVTSRAATWACMASIWHCPLQQARSSIAEQGRLGRGHLLDLLGPRASRVGKHVLDATQPNTRSAWHSFTLALSPVGRSEEHT